MTITLTPALTARVQALVDAGLADWDNLAETGIERCVAEVEEFWGIEQEAESDVNIITHETERCHELQRQLQAAEKFRELVAEMRIKQRQFRRTAYEAKRSEGVWYGNKLARSGRAIAKALKDSSDRLEDAVDRELRLLACE